VKDHVYHLEFHGSFSLKAVLPALVQGFSYEGMEVSHGGEAGMVWDHMVRGNSNPEERKRLKAALLAYCRQDTQAMARVLESLKSLTATHAGSH
jgi:hypothetical protein